MSLFRLCKEGFQWRIFLTCIVLSAGGSFLFGLSMTILTPSEMIIRQLINDSFISHYHSDLSENVYHVLWPLMLNIQIVGCGLGALPLVKLAENLGRRKTFYVASVLAIVGLLLQLSSKWAVSFEMLIVGRLVLGFASGLSLPLEGMYYNEISPTKLRGFFCSITGVSVELGFLMGGVLPLPEIFGTERLWPTMFGVQIVPVLVLLAVLPFLPESPKYLLSRGKKDRCENSLKFFGHQNVDESMREISTEIESQKDQVKWRQLWTKRCLRKGALMGILVQQVVVMSGIVAVEFYATGILRGVGLTFAQAQYALVGMLAASFLGAMLGSVTVEKMGRRLLLLSTTAILIAMNCLVMAMTIVFDHTKAKWAGYVSIAACVVLLLAFAIGPAVLQWVLPVEVVPQNAHSAMQMVTSVTKNIGFLFVGVTFYPMQITIGPYCFILEIVCLTLLFVVFVFFLPETKGKESVEIMRSFGYDDSDSDKNSERKERSGD